jgi:hypothetical protein
VPVHVAEELVILLAVTVVVSAQPTAKASRAVRKKVNNFFITLF